MSPLDEGGTEAVADFLLLFVEELLGHFLPGKAQITDGGDEAQANRAAGREQEGAVVVEVTGAEEVIRDGLMSEVTRGDEVRDGGAAGLSGAPAFGEVHFDEGSMFAVQPGERVQRFDHAGALGPAAAGSGGEADHRDGAGFEGLSAQVVARSGGSRG